MIRTFPSHIQVQSVFAAIVIAVAVIAAASPARSAEAVVLKSPLTVDGPVIRLGDLFDGAGEAADIKVADAPAPGEARLFYPSALQRLALAKGLHWGNPDRLKRVRVTRNGRPVAASELTRILAEALKEDLAANAVDVQMSNPRLVIWAPVDAEAPAKLEDVVLDRRTGRFDARLRIAADTPEGRLVPVSGRASALVPVPVPARPIAREEVVTADAIHWIEMRANRVPANALMDEARIVGQQARRSLKADGVFRATDLREPVVVAKGEIITMSYAVPGVQLTDRGRALENGGVGDIIRIMNLSSNRTITAEVGGPGLVHVAGSVLAMR